MILRKYMSILGIGSAQIDLILPKEEFQPGECIKGYFLIKGGVIEQQLKRIDCDLVMADLSSGTEKVIETANILTSKQIQSEEQNRIDFRFSLPEDLADSTEERSYYFNTRLVFNEGVISKDQDFITVKGD
ncbi:sporulation protein [Metabacillus idriensis]|uniref:Sporulation protein n=1 Tax=Metabacillus idriensis TaxID=324768 RepID=A0A6I2M5W2_9BACI|nr:sporulation protein [Metabacillus idriensis]MCM3595076.1 sporulation protein [Metabacillus idriensis]MRX52897.1 sporulation protein [Metabacillus idriensis]OHR65523.1 sporulation protein [Bacillus sp. HMSC76G11]